ncbi:MAG: DUF2786 domain-containing protein [Pirellulales bacterium]
MEFVWNDGGRASSGFVGLAGDCVVRAIAIATGSSYRDIYAAIGDATQKTPRNGVRPAVFDGMLSERGWTRHSGAGHPFNANALPKGPVIVHLTQPESTKSHLCTVIDHVIHDTWNPYEDGDYRISDYWTSDQPLAAGAGSTGRNQAGGMDGNGSLTQAEFDKILKRLRALDNTASNDASTEGEKRNALRMMQDLMLRHNLNRRDITQDDKADSVQFTRLACPVSGARACTWEVMLAAYITTEILPVVQWFRSSHKHRTMFWFYGPWSDVRNAIELFREMLMTIAASAMLRYGGYARGSGASYAEGYVAGLPRAGSPMESAGKKSGPNESDASPESQVPTSQERALATCRTLAVQETASEWLWLECNIRLHTVHRSGRYGHDPGAASRGREDGAKHEVTRPAGPPRIGHRGG